MTKHFDVAVIGAGAVGCACALYTQEAGLSVALVDKSASRDKTSYGNAGVFSVTGFAPINSPSVVKNLPKLMFGKDSPLAINWFYALTNLPWMLKFLQNCAPEKVAYMTEQLAILSNHAAAGFMPMIKRAGAEDLLNEDGALYIYSTKEGFDGAKAGIDERIRLGADMDILNEAETLEMEPNLKLPIYRSLRSNENGFISSPGELVERLMARFTKEGGVLVEQHAISCSEDDDRVHVRLDDGSTFTCAKLVIAAGAHSKKITGSGAEHLPLDTERGYHVVYHGAQDKVSRPVGWADAGFYVSPMAGGLRFAGTVELAGLNKPPSQNRIDYIARRSKEMISGLGEPDETWLGFRPTFPDALPAIGPAPGKKNILLAFGHQHLGLTFSGITGRVIADLVQERSPNFDVSGFSPVRF
ncbi:MAG: NAD(P)/FAD-dependent oxidoreductase [Hyphomicrobiales bacterium]